MTERHTFNHNNSRTHEGALLIDDARVDVMGANGGHFERPPTPEMLKKREIGQAAINTTLMRKALLENAQLQILEQERKFYAEPVSKEDIVQNNYDLAR